MNAQSSLLLVDIPFLITCRQSIVQKRKRGISMEYVVKFVTNPVVGVVLSVVGIVGAVAVPLFDYKIKHFNRKRYLKYLIHRIRVIRFELFQPKDAMVATLASRAVGVVVITIAVLGLWLISNMLMIMKAMAPEKVTLIHTVSFWLTVCCSMATAFFQGKMTKIFLRQTEILSRPKACIASLRDEVLTSSKRLLLEPQEVEEVLRTLDELEWGLQDKRKSDLTRPVEMAEPETVASGTPAPRESAHPVQ
jgi:hypothetical protein